VLKAFLTPRWLVWHALLVLALIGLGRVGWWQWETARAEGDWQNYGYALQWWLFGGFAVFLWVKLILDELDPARLDARAPVDRPPVVQRRAPAPRDDEDDELAAYNRRLAELAENDRR
jgi:DNA-binding transcriptional regulator of glucitol operon